MESAAVEDAIHDLVQKWLERFQPSCSVCGNERDWNSVPVEGARAMIGDGDAHYHPRVSIVCCACGAVVSLSLQHLQGWGEAGFSSSYRSIVARR